MATLFHSCELCEPRKDTEHPILEGETEDSFFYVVGGFVFCEKHHRELIDFIRAWIEIRKNYVGVKRLEDLFKPKKERRVRRNSLRINPDDDLDEIEKDVF